VIGYPRRHYGAILPARDTGFVPQGKFIMFWCFIPYNRSGIDQACSQDGWILARSFFACLFFSPISTQKKNFSNIQPSWPHTWSITHVSFHYSIQRSALLFSRFFSDDQMMGCVDLLKLTWGPPNLFWRLALNKNVIELEIFFLNKNFILAKFVNFRCFFAFPTPSRNISEWSPFSSSRFFHSFYFPE